jgi:Co/Zn/Cd efflux system component
MVVYSIAEIAFSLHFDSLVIFSDGLHNLSDGVALAG